MKEPSAGGRTTLTVTAQVVRLYQGCGGRVQSRPRVPPVDAAGIISFGEEALLIRPSFEAEPLHINRAWEADQGCDSKDSKACRLSTYRMGVSDARDCYVVL